MTDLTSEIALFDSAVVGVGPIGLIAGLLIAKTGRRVALIGPDVSGDETRTVALLQGTVNVLRNLDLWEDVEAHSAPLSVMRLIDNTNRLIRAPEVTFKSVETGLDAFGYNVPVKKLTELLREKAASLETITVFDQLVVHVAQEDDRVSITLKDDQTVFATSVVGADGRNSICRAAMGVDVSTRAYPQTALALNLKHTKPHNNISTEFHREHGPMVLVPMPGNHSSIVLVEKPEKVEEYLEMTEAALGREITRLSHRLLGEITVDGPARGYPLQSMTANAFAKGRIGLIGEAAHVMPPIGAQGLNLGVRDAAVIADYINEAGVTYPTIEGALEAYGKARRADVLTRVGSVDLLNRSLLSGFIGLQGARAMGLYAIKAIGPLRRMVMREGMEPALAQASALRAP